MIAAWMTVAVGRQIQTDDPGVLTAGMRTQRCWLQESAHGGRADGRMGMTGCNVRVTAERITVVTVTEAVMTTVGVMAVVVLAIMAVDVLTAVGMTSCSLAWSRQAFCESSRQ